MERNLNIGIQLSNSVMDQIEKLFNFKVKLRDHNTTFNPIDKILQREYYDCYLQNITSKNDKNTRVRILMSSNTDNKNNLKFIKTNNDNILIIEGININDLKFLVTNIKLLPQRVTNIVSKSIRMNIKFFTNVSVFTSSIPKDVLKQIAELPNAREMHKKVEKNIKDWDSYLSIIEKNAKESQLDLTYKGYKQEKSTHCTFIFNKFKIEEVEKLKAFRNERVILYYWKKQYKNNKVIIKDEEYEDAIQEYIGEIEKIDYKNNTIKIELEPEYQELALKNKLSFPSIANIRISKMGDLAQAKNLRRGLFQLKIGQVCNPNLDIMLFNSSTIENSQRQKIKINENDFLLKTLNTKQKEAVQGVLNTCDIFFDTGSTRNRQNNCNSRNLLSECT